MARRTDETGFCGYKLIQDSEGFSYGVDAVLLSDFCNALSSDEVLDLGTGNGVVPLIVHAKYRPERITGIELQQSAFDLAVENARLNGLQDSIVFIHGDVKDIRELVKPGSIDLVTCNPPYFESGRGVASDGDAKHTARHETTACLEDFIAAAEWSLRKGGRFVMVHRPSRMADIISYSRKHGLEPKRLQMVVPRIGESPNIMLIECIKGAGKELKILPELAVRNPDGSYTQALNRIYGK